MKMPAILLVDDDSDDLFALRAALGGLGLEIDQAGDGREALRLLLTRDFACVVIDLMMPGLNGFEIAAMIRARERSRDLPILILSGFDPDGMRFLPGYQADLEHLSKPVSLEILRAKVAELAGRASGTNH